MAQPIGDMPISIARAELGEVVNRAYYSGRITYLRKAGKRMAAIVPAEVAEAIEAAEDAADLAAAEAALARIAAGAKPIPWEQAKAELAERDKKRGQ
ncbi:MAG TPA: prevent-host-death protein [Micromonosporaceae bacterium]